MTPVVIMAGGRGLRLHPLTEKHPKPMLKVGGRPILEQIIAGFAAQGFKRIYLCLNYKAALIEAYFGRGESLGVKIRCVVEGAPLGTAGALGLLPRFDVPFIVCNADVLASLKYGHLMSAHAVSGCQATVCFALHQVQIPYGVASFDDEGNFEALREKPIEQFMVNAGIYVLDPKALDHLPQGPSDMPDLIASLETVNHFAIEDYWCDVGQFEDLARANTEWPGP